MRIPGWLVVACALCVVGSVDVAGQNRAYVALGYPGSPGTAVVADLDAAQLATLRLADAPPDYYNSALAVTGDGQFLVRVLTRQGLQDQTYLDVSGVDGSGARRYPLGPGSFDLYVNPRRPSAYLGTQTGLRIADPGGFRNLSLCDATPPTVSGPLNARFSADGRVFAAVCRDLERVALVDAVHDTLLRYVDVLPGTEQAMPSADGSALILVRSQPTPVLRRIDAVTGDVVAEREPADYGAYTSFSPAGLTTAADRLALRCSGAAGSDLLIVDTTTLEFVRPLPQPVTGVLRFSPDDRWAVGYTPYSDPAGYGLQLFDTGDWSLRAALPPIGFPVITLTSPPLAPVSLQATVAGRTVALAWALLPHSPLDTGLVIEAGSAPGLVDLAVLPLPAGTETTTVENVPPGTYYVRVRARNGLGLGPPSATVRVDVE